MLATGGPGQNLQARKFVLNRFDDLESLWFVVDRNDKDLRALCSSRLEQVEPGCVAIERFQSILGDGFYPVRIVIEDGRAKTIRAKKTADDVAEPAEPGEDDWIVVL